MITYLSFDTVFPLLWLVHNRIVKGINTA